MKLCRLLMNLLSSTDSLMVRKYCLRISFPWSKERWLILLQAPYALSWARRPGSALRDGLIHAAHQMHCGAHWVSLEICRRRAYMKSGKAQLTRHYKSRTSNIHCARDAICAGQSRYE